MQLISRDLGIDLGTSNVLVYKMDTGIVAREPSVVALDRNSGKVLQVGAAARNMMGRTPGNVVAMHPLKDGVVADHDLTVKMLQKFFRDAGGSSMFTPKPRVVISIPSGVTQMDERAVINAAMEAGARRVYLIEEPLAAALGAGLDLSGPRGHLVVDIGGGTTDIAVLTMNGVANASSIKLAGNHFDESIARYVRAKYHVVIGASTAEDIKIQIGSVFPRSEETTMVVRGRDSKSGMPRDVSLTASEICGLLQKSANRIADEVLSVLEDTSPELVGDIADSGIVLTGGGSQLWGMDMLLQSRIGIPCTVADDPASCVAYGCGKSLSWISKMTEGPANLARKRLMQGF
ncbi:MAG: rod shape-determining protein MreB [Oscillospiraceae bacterium]|nr:rod shape-determining protein MreB [Oscillospiraceae bacterium]